MPYTEDELRAALGEALVQITEKDAEIQVLQKPGHVTQADKDLAKCRESNSELTKEITNLVLRIDELIKENKEAGNQIKLLQSQIKDQG